MIRLFRKSFVVFPVVLCLSLLYGCKYFKSGPSGNGNQLTQVYTEMDNFLFAGKSGERVGVFLYEFTKKQARLLWSSKTESVVDISHNARLRKAYFITVNESGEKQSLPYYKKAKIYFIDLTTLKISGGTSLDDGLQLYAYWGTNNTITVLANSVDKTIATYINQKNWIFNDNGEQVFGQQKTYDITKDGYPQLSIQPNESHSFNGTDILYLKNKDDVVLKSGNEEIMLVPNLINSQMQKIEWSADDRFVVFSMVKAVNSQLKQGKASSGISTLYAASIVGKRILFSITGKKYKQFEIINQYVVYTDANKNIPYIVLYDLEKLRVETEIHTPGGCSIKNLSEYIANNKH